MTLHFEGYAHALYEQEINTAKIFNNVVEKKLVCNLNTTTREKLFW